MKLGIAFVGFVLSLRFLHAEPNEGKGNAPDKGTWIAIVPPAFESVVKPLAQHRRSEGWQVEIRKRDDLIRDGQTIDLAIRDFLYRTSIDSKVSKPVVAVLVGVPMLNDNTQDVTVPAIKGTFLRAKNVPSDSGYSLKDGEPIEGLSVGRLPARDAKDLQAMSEKILKFESEPGAARWKTRLSVVAASSGGGPIADAFVRMQLRSRLKKLPGEWTVEQVADLHGSAYNVPRSQLKTSTKSLVERGQLFSCFLGHSAPGFVVSNGVRFFVHDDFGALNIETGNGVFLTCGCESLAVDVPGKDGYGFAAMRAPSGPSAVIGAEGISYAALGMLAIDGLVEVLDSPTDGVVTLGDCWNSVFEGIHSGGISPSIFMLMDQGDGSGGRVPLADQRKEHLEMWMLLGDPAMRLPIIPGGIIMVSSTKKVVPMDQITITGKLPQGWDSANVIVTAERLPGAKPALPSQSGNKFVLCKAKTSAAKGTFGVSLTLPEALPGEKLIIRALAENGNGTTQGSIYVPVKELEEKPESGRESEAQAER